MAQLTAGEWDSIFREAEELGISFIMLVGGEPLLRRDIIRAIRLSRQEENQMHISNYLKITGSMVLDRVNKIAYA